MRIAALGGCGGMGRYAVRTAITYDFVDQVLVADKDLDRAAAFAEEIGPKAQAIALDAADDASLDRVISGCDAVLNTVGPFFEFGVPILRAAIRNAAHYFDINDDWEPTIAMLELGPDAESAGVTAVIGLGASPGVSNLLAIKAMEGMDTVDTVTTGWGIGHDAKAAANASEGDHGGPSAALLHWLHQCSGTIRVMREGRLTDVAPLEERTIDYPGLGIGRAWSVGHPEAVTLPRIREMRESVNVMVGSPAVIEVLRGLARRIDDGELTVHDAAVIMSTGAFPDVEVDESPLDKVYLPAMFAHAAGSRDGKQVRQGAVVLALPPTGMGGATGVPLACGLAELAAGRLEKRGVFAPEEVIDPSSYLEEVGKRCRPVRGSAGEMLLVSRSDEVEPR